MYAYTKGWLLFAIAFVHSTDYCNSAFPRSNTGDTDDGGVIVQLYRWRFDDIARECEQFLAPKGYSAVEVAPITEHWVGFGKGPAWDEPYYPVSYNILSRSGDEKSFIQMVQRCNKAGIKVYVSVVLAYMAKDKSSLIGFGGSFANSPEYSYPAVPYDGSDFTQCDVSSVYNTKEMRTCDQPNDHHLDHTKPKVRRTLRNFLNKLISFGVAGFNIDAANRIHPDHLRAIFARLRYLNNSHGFDCESEPYIYEEYDTVKTFNDEAASDYYNLGRLADYNYRYHVNRAFRGYGLLSNIESHIHLGKDLLPNKKALVFIDSQSALKGKASYRIMYNNHELIAATAFMLAYPFGQPRIASNYYYSSSLYDAPPMKGNLTAPVTFDGENCTNGWICEHRWPEIYNMINFRNVVAGANVSNFWSDGNDNLAFSRGDKGFVVFNGNFWNYRDFNDILQTGLPKGKYCDVITGTLKDNQCTGKTITVDERGLARFIRKYNELGVTAIHVEARLQ